MKGGVKMEKKTWIMLIVVILVVGVIALILATNNAQNSPKLSPMPTSKPAPTKSVNITNQTTSSGGSGKNQTSNQTASGGGSNATSRTGSLSVSSVPSGASLSIDKVSKGVTPITVYNLSIGNHAIRITYTGYNAYATTRYINAGSNSFNATLVRATNQTGITNQTNITA